ncbi:MAG: hypothetical protein QOK25_799 [Thermoleophilaceae bacterium]|nr:hypothetical protein [Thermoleophilaceae bacterium]
MTSGAPAGARRAAIAALAALLAALALAPADAVARHRKKPPRATVVVNVLTLTQQEARDSGVLHVELRASRDATVRLHALLRDGKGKNGKGTLIAPNRTIFIKRGQRINFRLKLSGKGRLRFGQGCAVLPVSVVARARGFRHGRDTVATRRLPSLKACPGSGGGGSGGGVGSGQPLGNGPGPALTYSIGTADRSIGTEPDGKWKGAKVYLGGYGISGGQPIADQGRAANGILGTGPRVHAFALSDGKHPFAMADIEVQGWFVANKDLPYGLIDMRKEVARRTGGALGAEHVFIQSDHSHGGADPMGVWGNSPNDFRKYMFEQTVAAIVDAWQHRQPANLYYGYAPARDLQSNQFDYDASNKVMDSDVRVLQARGSDDKPIATILDFSSHPTVDGSSNQHIAGDWPQQANLLMAKRYGGAAMTIVGTLGRTQPADRGCPSVPSGPNATDSIPSYALCKLDDYAGKVVNRVDKALANATLIAGKPVVDSKSYLIQDPADNGVVYVGLGVGGAPIGVPIDRALTPPWLQGNILGTVTGTARIGDVILSSVPGEIYPQIALKVAASVPDVRAHGFMTAGLSNDQLGYIIYPYTDYPEPILSTFIVRGDSFPCTPTPDPKDPQNSNPCPLDPIGNDNYAFNVSKTLGARVTCSLLRGAGDVFGKGSKYRDANSECAPFANDTLFADGMDVNFPTAPVP